MSSDSIARDVRRLLDIREIEDVLKRYVRGYDRGSAELMLSCYHPGALDMHGTVDGPATEFVPNSLARAAQNGVGVHPIMNVTIEFEGDDTAWSEAYFVSWNKFLDPDGDKDVLLAGRYLDRFERRDGDWKIAHRQVAYDFMREDPANEPWHRPPFANKILKGVRGPQDYVFTRRKSEDVIA